MNLFVSVSHGVPLHVSKQSFNTVDFVSNLRVAFFKSLSHDKNEDSKRIL